ncbi:unnamed protein product [Symbiodinium pilosum]|uniref:Uncharacterized protein n=1 Tax=Symbiodinium pilosum TaxID=2952 RepID=A0A812WBE1_SYMPI|nr:unnamed protein product [Symbiodinium pilosum]
MQAATAYAMRGRKAVMDTILPFMEDKATTDPEKAFRLIDHVEFLKFAKAMQEHKTEKKHQRMALTQGHLKIEDLSELSDHDDDDMEEHIEFTEQQASTDIKHAQALPSTPLSAVGLNASAAAHWCVGKTVALWNHAHQHYIRMSNSRIEKGAKGWKNDMPYSWTWERFVCVDVGNGELAFHSTEHNRFLRLNNGVMDRSNECSKDFIPDNWTWERFKLKDMGNGHFALFNQAWKKVMKMDHGNAVVTISRNSVNSIPSSWTWEKFYIQEVSQAPAFSYWFITKTVFLWNDAHKYYIRMDKDKNVEKSKKGWKDPFPGDWDWERWVPIMAGHGEVAFHNTQWNRFLRMNNQGRMDASGPCDWHHLREGMTWERFKVMQMGNGNIALYNTAHRRFVKMDGGNGLVTSAPMDFWDLPDWWTWEKFYMKEVGEVRRCNFWCRLASPFVKVFKAVTSFVTKLLQCFGQFAVTANTGYSRDINPPTVAVNVGISGGAQYGLQSILKGKPPSVSMALKIGAAAGSVTAWSWLGVGVSVSVSCKAADTFGCKFGIAVGAIAKGWRKKGADALGCVFGPTVFGAFECKSCVGGTMLLFCCSYDFLTGDNSCR